MTDFENEIQGFKAQIHQWQDRYPQWQDQIVFNSDLLGLKPEKVRYILVGDNPGKEERKAGRYLVGMAGKGARRFFEETSKLVTSFDKEIMVLNKTPVFTPATLDLGNLTEMRELLEESQRYMGGLMIRLQKRLGCPLWITGFSGCRTTQGKWNLKPVKTRPLAVFFQSLREEALNQESDLSKIAFFKHFSYGNFVKDVHREEELPRDPKAYLAKLEELGVHYKKDFFCRND